MWVLQRFNSRKLIYNLKHYNVAAGKLFALKQNDLCKFYGIRRLNVDVDKPKVVLGIETSCDDTGAAVVNSNGDILGGCLHSQHLVHLANGGIIPPIAKELHKKHIDDVVTRALEQSKLSLKDLDAIATTVKPGLELSLIIGLNYAKQLVRKCGKPFIPIHHMEAHALTVRLTERVDFPYLVLLVSGGHCQLAIVRSVDDFMLLGSTLDDSPGEAFDKTARRLKLRNIKELRFMSGGKAIETLALSGDPLKYNFTPPLQQYKDCNFSFAGLKFLALKTILKEEHLHGIEADGIIPNVADVCASFQHAVVRHLVKRVHRAMIFTQDKDLLPESNRVLVISGGVACNQYIRNALNILCDLTQYKLVCPPPKLCTDNGVMIAWNGIERFSAKTGVADVENVKVEPQCKLGRDISREVSHASITPPRIKCDPQKIREYTKISLEKIVNKQ